MNRIDRLHAILTVLQSKRVVTAEELATRFDISIRTVYRDLRALEEGGIPIGAEAGIGYYLSEGFHLPPVMFTHEEARSILLAGKFLEKNTDKKIQENFHLALTKIRAVLDSKKQEDLDGLENKIIVNPFSSARPQQDDLYLNQIKHSLSSNQVLRITYTTGKETTKRDVEPIGLCFYSSKWHLIGYCRLRKDYRDFRLDRLGDLHCLQETFLRIRHPNLKEYLDKLMKEFSLVHVVINVHKNALPHIQESKYSMGLVEEITGDVWTQMTFATFSYEYFCRWMIMIGKNAEIVSPDELKETMKALVKDLYAQHFESA